MPVFSDKHLEDDWADIAWFYGEARRLKIPLMAGSSLPTLWRYPEADVERGKPLKEIVATSLRPARRLRLSRPGNGPVPGRAATARRFLGRERRQASPLPHRRRGLASRPRRRVRPQAARRGSQPPQAKAAAAPANRSKQSARIRSLYVVDYRDGLRASILWASPINEWTVAWRYADGSTQSTCFWTQEGRPYMHFTYLLKGVEQMMHTGQPTWPVERTLLTSGTLDAALQSHSRGGQIVETP